MHITAVRPACQVRRTVPDPVDFAVFRLIILAVSCFLSKHFSSFLQLQPPYKKIQNVRSKYLIFL